MFEDLKFYDFESVYGGTYSLTPSIGMYHNNSNLCLKFMCYDKEEGVLEPYCFATVNTVSLPYLQSAVDTNNNSPGFVDFLEANGFGKRTAHVVHSGFCTFPVFQFDEDKLREIDPKAFAAYQKEYGIVKPGLDEKISDAQAKSGKPLQNKRSRTNSR